MKKMVEAYWVKTLVRGCFFYVLRSIFLFTNPMKLCATSIDRLVSVGHKVDPSGVVDEGVENVSYITSLSSVLVSPKSLFCPFFPSGQNYLLE